MGDFYYSEGRSLHERILKAKRRSKKMEKKVKPAPTKLSAYDALCRAVAAEYAGDALTAGVGVAFLPQTDVTPGYYASVARYPLRDKVVVAKTFGHPTPEAAVEALAREWLGASAPKDALRRALGLP